MELLHCGGRLKTSVKLLFDPLKVRDENNQDLPVTVNRHIDEVLNFICGDKTKLCRIGFFGLVYFARVTIWHALEQASHDTGSVCPGDHDCDLANPSADGPDDFWIAGVHEGVALAILISLLAGDPTSEVQVRFDDMNQKATVCVVDNQSLILKMGRLEFAQLINADYGERIAATASDDRFTLEFQEIKWKKHTS